jgi:protein ImuB
MSVWLPAWPVDLLRRRDRRSPELRGDRRAILLIEHERQRQVVADCCERARGAGVRPGMPVARARAILPAGGARIEPRDAGGDGAALRALAAWAQRFSPVVAPDPPDGLLLDVTGCERVFGGEDRLARGAAEALGRLGISARCVVAPTFGCAWAVARFGGAMVIADGRQREAIAGLPVAALRLEAPMIEALAEVGIARVQHLLELPRAALPARFGDELLLRLDRALGAAIEMIEPVRPVPPPGAERLFDGPTDRTEAIERTVRNLLDEVAAALAARQIGAREVEVVLARSDLPPERLSVTLGRPSRDAAHLWTLLRPKLERAHLGFGVEGVRVHIGSVGRLRHEQAEHWLEGRGLPAPEAERARDELLDTLANRLGADRVLRASVVESHLPERAFAFRPAAAPATTPMGRGAATARDRPTLLFDPPCPAEVVFLSPDGPIMRVRWRGGEVSVVAGLGPERIAPEWWRSAGSTRDYFAARGEDGRWLWLARSAESGRWFVHGAWA